jgi:hypothetical protein
MSEIKITNRINPAARNAALEDGKRVEPAEKTSCEIAQARRQIQDIGHADHGHTAWLEHAKDFAKQRARLFEVRDRFDTSDQTKSAIQIRQLIGIEIDDVHSLGRILHQCIGVITSTGTKAKTSPNCTYQFAVATSDIERFAGKGRVDVCRRDCVKHRALDVGNTKFRGRRGLRSFRSVDPPYDFANGQ